MSTYVLSDIHGCYDEMKALLEKVGFSESDELIVGGDYIDRGKKSHKMLEWIENPAPNVTLLKGNHDYEYTGYVAYLEDVAKEKGMKAETHEDAHKIYHTAIKKIEKDKKFPREWFDPYQTVSGLIRKHKATMNDLRRWADVIDQLPYYTERRIAGRDFIVVHAGYVESDAELHRRAPGMGSVEEFYLYARDDSITIGGKEHATIVAGHTPTVSTHRFSYNKGRVFTHYDKERDCYFYDIDCGCYQRTYNPDARLACLCLEDREITYY